MAMQSYLPAGQTIPDADTKHLVVACEDRSRSHGVFARVCLWFAHRRKIRRGRNDLLALSDAQLKDIGLSRGEGYHDFYVRF